MRRRLFKLLSTTSLLLCVASSFMWVYSQWRNDTFFVITDHHACWVEIKPSVLRFQLDRSVQTRPRTLQHRHWTQWDPTLLPEPGFACHTSNPGALLGIGGITAYILQVPDWFLVAAFALLPASRLILRLKSGELGSDPCPSCGYDLRATPDRCPECGTMSQKVNA